MAIETEDDAAFVADMIRQGKLAGDAKEQAFSDIESFKSQGVEPDLPGSKSEEAASKMTSIPFLATPVAKFAAGSYLGLKKAGIGFDQLTNSLNIRKTDEEKAIESERLSSELSKRDAQTESLGSFGEAGSMTGEVLPSMVMPGGPAGGVIKKLAGGVAMDTLASVADPVRDDESRAGNLGRAAVGSGVIRGAGAGISGGVKRFMNARAGNIADAAAAEVVDAGARENVSVFFDDVSNPLAKKASQAAEIFGKFGTGHGRATQNKEALAAADSWLDKLSGDFGDYAETVQEGLKVKLGIFKRAAARKYERAASQIASNGGDGIEVGTDQFNRTLKDAVAAESAKGSRANPEVINFLTKYDEAPRGSFQEMIEFRSDFLADVRNMDDLNFSSKSEIMKVQDAIVSDMNAFADKYGAGELWRAANGFYKDNVVEFQIGKLKNLLNDKSAANFDAQSAWRYLNQTNTNPKRAAAMWKALDSKSRAAVRYGLLKDAYDAATPTGSPFSPAKFASYLENRMPVAEQFFKGSQKQELKGMVNMMRHIERAGQYAENPPTGQRIIPLLFAGSAYFEPTLAAMAGGSAITTKGLFQTKLGRNLLLAASTSTPGSKQFDGILEQIMKATSRSTGQNEDSQSSSERQSTSGGSEQ